VDVTTTLADRTIAALRALGSFAALLILAGAAADPSAAGTPTVEEILAHHAAARGGAERLKAVRTIIYRGTYREGGRVVMPHAAMALMRPYYKLVGDPEHPDPDFAEGYDGSAWELYGDPGIVLRTVGAASAAGRHATRIGGPLLDAADDYPRAASSAFALGRAYVAAGDVADGRAALRQALALDPAYERAAKALAALP